MDNNEPGWIGALIVLLGFAAIFGIASLLHEPGTCFVTGAVALAGGVGSCGP